MFGFFLTFGGRGQPGLMEFLFEKKKSALVWPCTVWTATYQVLCEKKKIRERAKNVGE